MKNALKTARSAASPRSGFIWVGLVAACIACCTRGLSAETGKSAKAVNRAVSNEPISAAERSSGTSQGQIREPRLLRNDPPVNEPESSTDEPGAFPGGFQPQQLVSPGGLSSTINLMLVLTILSLAPSILIMTTCFIRFIIVTSLLRQALGTQQLPPNQVLVALCLFLTFLVMSPVWQQSYEEGIRPYTSPEDGEEPPALEETFRRTARPIREFMFNQIRNAGNMDTLWMFLEYQYPEADPETGESRSQSLSYGDVSLPTLMSAYMLSELKVAFVIGFQIFLPFLVIDMVVSTVLMSMGMMMLPPTLVSFPFKLLLFVLIDGWARIVGMLLASVHGSGSG